MGHTKVMLGACLALCAGQAAAGDAGRGDYGGEAAVDDED